MSETEFIPAHVRRNRELVQAMRNPDTKEMPKVINKENQLKIGNDKIQLIMNQNGIDTIEKLMRWLENGLFPSPMHKKIVKNFINDNKTLTP